MLFQRVPWGFSQNNKLEQFKFKLEKILGFRNMQEIYYEKKSIQTIVLKLELKQCTLVKVPVLYTVSK